MKFLLTNDDGVNAAGLRAVEYFLLDLGHEVFVSAPSGEQSGVSRSITFLTPLFATKAYDGLRWRGYAVDGTPVDCVKLALYELCPWRPDVVISGINGGLNAGINIHYSGTVGGAFEAAVSGILSFALSLEYQDEAPYEEAMAVIWPVMQPILDQHFQRSEAATAVAPAAGSAAPPTRSHLIYNINVPTVALRQSCPVSVVPMESRRNGIEFNAGHCPKNRRYYWATHDLLPEQPDPPTDVFALRQGHITVTPLEINMTCDASLHRLQERLQGIQASEPAVDKVR
jgi:5'-nucleotidase